VKEPAKKTRDGVFRTISVKEEVFEELLKIKAREAERLGVRLSWTDYFMRLIKQDKEAVR